MTVKNTNSKQTLDMEIRDFKATDYPELASIYNSVYPDMPLTAEEFIEFDQKRDKKCRYRRWMVTVSNNVVGTGFYTQNITHYHPNKFYLQILILPDYQNRGIGSRLYETIISELINLNPISITTKIRDDKNYSIPFLETRDFKYFQQFSEPELNVNLFDFSPYNSLLEKTSSDGIIIKTLKNLEGDSQRNAKLFKLVNELIKDMPNEEENTPMNYETFQKMILEASYTLPDAFFVAIDGDKYIGLSVMVKQKKDNFLYTDVTGVISDYRRRGLATLLKLKGIDYAKRQKIALIRTGNHSANKPMRKLNDKLGFKNKYNWLYYRKDFK